MLDDNYLEGLSVPLEYWRFASLFDRLSQSRTIITLLKKELTHYKSLLPSGSSVCVFGSMARGEFNVDSSDIDLMFFGFTEPQRDKLLRVLASNNHCLDFHEALLLLDATPPDRKKLNLRFPCSSQQTMFAEPNTNRRLQFLLEAKPLYGEKVYNSQIQKIILSYDLKLEKHVPETPQKLIAGLKAFFSGMAQENAARVDKNSDYFVKYFIRRELSAQIIRLSLVGAIFCKKRLNESERPDLLFTELLKQPVVGTLLFWTSNYFLMGRTVDQLANKFASESSAVVETVLKTKAHPHLKASEGIVRVIQVLALDALYAYSNTIRLLHTPLLRARLAAAPPNVLNWQMDPNLKHVSDQINETKECISILAETLATLFDLASRLKVFQKPYRGSGLEASIEFLLSK